MKEFLNLSVCVMHEDHSYDVLYNHIATWDEADLLAQYAMGLRTTYADLIFVFPGWNRGIKDDPNLLSKAEVLAQEYAYRK